MKQLLLGTVIIIWDVIYFVWILESITSLSMELQRGTFCCLMVGEETGSYMFLCSTGGHSLALVPS